MFDAGDVEEVVFVIIDDERSSAKKPTNATATTIVKSEIERRNAKDTKFIVPPERT